VSGSRDDVCGGGIWAPSGPVVQQRADGFELYVPTGNGQLDLARRDYANTVMRLGPGLGFDPRCDAAACASFDPDAPSEACAASCKDLFIPRLLPGEAPVRPESGVCDGKTLLQCYAALDWDLGANSPLRLTVPGGGDVMVLPAKDGAVYLFDAEHFGTLHDRETIVAPCGTPTDVCVNDWAGMMVTKPAAVVLQGIPRVLIPTFQFDRTHPAGLVALDVVREGGKPVLRPAWQAPRFDSPEALTRFRRHPGRVAVMGEGEAAVALVMDQAAEGSQGTLLAVRATDGSILARTPLIGPGTRYVEPLIRGRRVYLHSCDASPPSEGVLQAFDVVTAP
jgi:hypothetical protein